MTPSLFPSIDNPRNPQPASAQAQAVDQGFNLGDNVYESVSMSLANMLRGDPSASVRSLLASRTLPPAEHSRLLSEVTKPGGGVISGILRSLTNPLVIVGAAAAYKWPILDAAKLATAGEYLVKYEKWVPASLRKLMGLNEMFYGTELPRQFHALAADSGAFLDRHFTPLREALTAYEETAGRAVTAADQVRWAMQIEQPWANPKVLSRMNAEIGKVNDARQAAGIPGSYARLAPGHFAVQALAGDAEVVAAHRQVMGSIQAELSADNPRLQRMVKWLAAEKGVNLNPEGGIKWLPDYFPHVGTGGAQKMAGLQAQFMERLMTRGGVQGLADDLTQVKGARTGRLLKRSGVLLPNPDDLKLLKGQIAPEALASIQAVADARAAAGEIPAYTLRYADAMTHYGHSVGRAFAWNHVREGAETWTGDAFMREVHKVGLAEAAGGRGLGKTELLRDVYVPAALGRPTFHQTLKAMEWGGVRRSIYELLDNPEVGSWMPAGMKDKLQGFMAESGVLRGTPGSKLTQLFYLSTIGGNVGSAFQNLLQPILTTAPIVGARATLRGMGSVISKIPEYARMVQGGADGRTALAKLFPEFEARQLDLAPAFDEMFRGMEGSQVLGARGSRVWKAAKNKLMQPFRITEIFNRLSTFEAGRLLAHDAGHVGTAAGDFAQELTQVSQLWAGPASVPSFMANWPGWARQLTTFPVKLGAFGAASAASLGGPFNWGTLGRMAAYSATAYEMTRGITGGDLSRSLLFGALPMPEESGPFAPWPVVPPAVGLAGAVAMDVAGGQGFEQTRKQLPLLVPGGLQLARLSQAGYTPEIAQALGRTYADRSQMTPDGRIPQFSPDGRLVGYTTEWGLLQRVTGVPGKLLGPNGESNEQEMMKYLVAQRDQIVKLRQTYVQAVLDNDLTGQEAAAREHLQSFGIPIQVKESDLRGAQKARYLPRIDRMLQSLPSNLQPRYRMLAAGAMAGSAESFLGVSPEVLQEPRAERLSAYQEANRAQQPQFQGSATGTAF